MTESLKKADLCSIERCSDRAEFNGPTLGPYYDQGLVVRCRVS